MIGRRALLAVALVAGVIAAAVYWGALQRTTVVVVLHDLDGQRPIESDDVALRDLPPDAVPGGAARSVSEAIGRTPRVPVWAGQILIAAVLADAPSLFGGAVAPPGAQRAIAVPATPGLAVGGALVAGARVDVVAVPAAGRAPASRVTEVLAAAALVLDVRGEGGSSIGPRTVARGVPGMVPDRLGSIVIAVTPAEALRIADRIPVSTFVFVLIPPR